MDVRVHIERLVVDGLGTDPGGGTALGRSVQAELGRLLAGGLPALLRSDAAVPALRAQARPVGSDGRSIGLGAQVAQAVYRSLGAPPATGGKGER
jgi:hypothetical protein